MKVRQALETMPPRLSVVQIRSQDGEFLGSGHFIAAKEVLTCRHVVEARLVLQRDFDLRSEASKPPFAV